MGISYTDFWNSNPRIVNIYVKAQMRKQEMLDAEHWNLGTYVYEAVFVSIGKFFGGKEFDGEYAEKPHSSGVLSPEERQRMREEREIQRLIAEEERQIVALRKMGLPESNSKGG